MRFILITLGLLASAAAVFVSEGGPVRPEPGLWAFEPRVETLAVTGVPVENREAVKAALIDKLFRGVSRSCVSARQAEQPFSIERLRLGGFSSGECRFERSSLSDGRVDAAGVCRSARSSRRFSISGSVTSQSIDLVVNLDESVPAQGARMEASLRIVGRRVGPCQGSPQEALPVTQPRFAPSGVEATNAAADPAIFQAN